MAVKTPYYESRFIRANHPDQALALWLRETLLLPTVGSPVADVWVMVFDPDGAGNRALKSGIRSGAPTTAPRPAPAPVVPPRGTSASPPATNRR
ncbi:MAG: hypothetical protein JWP55_3290 [Mycobacterium sp.]|nr:hypothetical protein [Mycobacterium sp.]